ncbi:hypothetical protein E2C01_079481 [Portunus trituberculatus]|uniref:Uncharacterized protein n=1 Tax=Portunus trituberculatus TaxID=210409 RepID=A0A5B7ILM6_PORTR|nr:hypothetical protein [Portunus trituberculatus]
MSCTFASNIKIRGREQCTSTPNTTTSTPFPLPQSLKHTKLHQTPNTQHPTFSPFFLSTSTTTPSPPYFQQYQHHLYTRPYLTQTHQATPNILTFPDLLPTPQHNTNTSTPSRPTSNHTTPPQHLPPLTHPHNTPSYTLTNTHQHLNTLPPHFQPYLNTTTHPHNTPNYTL